MSLTPAPPCFLTNNSTCQLQVKANEVKQESHVLVKMNDNTNYSIFLFFCLFSLVFMSVLISKHFSYNCFLLICIPLSFSCLKSISTIEFFRVENLGIIKVKYIVVNENLVSIVRY